MSAITSEEMGAGKTFEQIEELTRNDPQVKRARGLISFWMEFERVRQQTYAKNHTEQSDKKRSQIQRDVARIEEALRLRV